MDGSDYALPILEGLYLTNRAQDWRQTRRIADAGNDYTEKNKLLGDKPSKSRVNNYMAGLALASLLGYATLPKEVQLGYMPLANLEVGAAVKGNKDIGLGTSGRINSLGALVTALLVAQKAFSDKGTKKDDKKAKIGLLDMGGKGLGLTYNKKF